MEIEIEYARFKEATQAPGLIMGEMTLNPEKCQGIRMFYKPGGLFCYFKEHLIVIPPGNIVSLVAKGKHYVEETKKK